VFVCVHVSSVNNSSRKTLCCVRTNMCISYGCARVCVNVCVIDTCVCVINATGKPSCSHLHMFSIYLCISYTCVGECACV